MCCKAKCPFDELPCSHAGSCDDVLSWRIGGYVDGESQPCSRAVFYGSALAKGAKRPERKDVRTIS